MGTRIRVSTTVDEGLLESAREALPGERDSQVLDAALAALCTVHRRAEIDRSYEAYDRIPLDAEDEWGGLGDFLGAAESELA